MITFPKKNQKINFNEFLTNYNLSIIDTLKNMDKKKLNNICDILEQAIIKKKKIFIIGNGGAGSVANHFLCDFNKGIKLSSKKRFYPKVISLVNSVETITAIGNDINFDSIFTSQIENYAEKGDILFAMSCSGTSKNIINTIKWCNKKKLPVIFITGFLEKKLALVFKEHLNLNVKNYGISEDVFSLIMHSISQFIRFKNISKNHIL